MRNVVATVESLRLIAEAGERFLGMFAVDCLVEERRVCERLVVDIMNAPEMAGPNRASNLYPGTKMDD